MSYDMYVIKYSLNCYNEMEWDLFLHGTLCCLNNAGDTVYVLRDMIEENAPKTSPPTKHTYKTIKNFSYSDLDIFRIERLWKDEK